MNGFDLFQRLLPRPRRITPTEGVCRPIEDLSVELHVDDARLTRAFDAWKSQLPLSNHPGSPATKLRVVVEKGQPHAQGYRLAVRRNEIEILGGSVAGAFYGLQTLIQLTDLCGDGVPCCVIEDHPDFAVRGLLHDVTRGKVPKLETLKILVDRLAALKCNQLQLYIEHAFTFAFDPEICGPDDGLTPDEIRELDAYCKAHFIDLVPAVATLGHMGKVLSMPRYRHLAEIEPTQTWEEMPWPQRARGFTLDVTNPDSHRLVEKIWSEILDAFSSPIVNICGDEPWDLGKGKNKDRFAATGTGPPYIDHILRTHAICAARGRKTQVWSDVVRNHTELFDRLPRDLTVMHWGYDDKSDYEGTRKFVDAGLETIVCPGTTGWKRILNAMNLAERNISTFAKAGKQHGAIGLINTDWGDHGHFNALACSWHGIALGAACAWDANHPTGEEFDLAFVEAVPVRLDLSSVQLLRNASTHSERCETWRLLWQPRDQVAADATLPAVEEAEELSYAASRCGYRLRRSKTSELLACRELILACDFTECFARRVRAIRTGGKVRWGAASYLPEFKRNWLARNKPSGLQDIASALDKADLR